MELKKTVAEKIAELRHNIEVRQAVVDHDRAELAALEAEERARRPALAGGQVWGCGDHRYLVAHDWAGVDKLYFVSLHGFNVTVGLASLGEDWFFVGLARDVLRVVPPKWEEERNLLLELESLYRGTSRESREMNAVLRKLDAIHNPSAVVPPEPPAPQVAPEPTGAELVGRRCWVRDLDDDAWTGPVEVKRYDPLNEGFPYATGYARWMFAKPYVEGVAP